jgi:heme-degrading monooxygenase HmoA
MLAQADSIDAGIDHVRNDVMVRMSHLDGFVGLSLMVDRDSGRCIATSAWRSEDAMRASAERASAIRDGAAAVFGTGATVREWEVAVMHRAHHARPGTCTRSSWVSLNPADLDRLRDLFTFETLASIEDLPGFCSASLMVNRTAGRAVVTVAYDDRDALDRTREPGSTIREHTAQQAGLEIIDVAEFDLAVAHLHVPEMV